MTQKPLLMERHVPPSLNDMQELAEYIISELPIGLKKYVGKLQVEVEDFPDAHIEEELELESPFDILGIYQSAGPINKNSISGKARKDMIILYRRPILDSWAESEDDLSNLVNQVILGEIGHHFGMTDAEMDIFEDEMIKEDDLIICGEAE